MLLTTWWPQAACKTAGDAETRPVIGSFTIFNRESSYLVSAPHGEFDDQTGEIVWQFCLRVRWDCLIAEGFRADHAPINVNRPTEGASLSGTRFTERASLVYARYVKRITRISPSLRFYVEIHGNEFKGTEEFIDVATVGLSVAQARRIESLAKQLLEEEGLGYLQPRIDVLEKIRYRATHARQFGVLSFIRPAVHLEFPLLPRTRDQKNMVNFLVKFLPAVARQEFSSASNSGKKK